MIILVVNDSEDTTEMVQHLLEIGGAPVCAATSGEDALRLVTEKDFDVVLSDISRPGMDGFEFLQKLRQLPGKRELPAVALTGLAVRRMFNVMRRRVFTLTLQSHSTSRHLPNCYKNFRAKIIVVVKTSF